MHRFVLEACRILVKLVALQQYVKEDILKTLLLHFTE